MSCIHRRLSFPGSSLKLVLLLCLLLLAVANQAIAQTPDLQQRETEWKNYRVPNANFVRQTAPEKQFIYRVPADWAQEGTSLKFNGPHNSSIRLFVQEVPDGYPLQDFVATVLRTISDTPGAADRMLTRRVQFQDLEAREIMVESDTAEGDLYRSTTWITLNGPLSVSINLQTPAEHALEIEPFFKAVVQSVMFVSIQYPAFEALRTSAIKAPAPGPINEVEAVVASLNEVNTDYESAVARLSSVFRFKQRNDEERVVPSRNEVNTNYESAVARLSSFFSSNPDVVVDLLVDSRPIVRSAAVGGLARSNNVALAPLLWRALEDPEPFVAETPAGRMAGGADVVTQDQERWLSGFATEPVARMWPFMAKQKRIELLQSVFNQTAVRPATPKAGKPGVSVSVSEMAPVDPAKPNKLPSTVLANMAQDPNIQIGALTLLLNTPREDFKLPLARLMAANYDPLVAVGLQVANARSEALPLDSLLKLAVSHNQKRKKLAVENLA